ncbi:NGG1p interacting factor 3 protein [Halorhabdus tiamatea SARL4B]|uniref:NGG1p interacting factor 3 protein n=1 Tax=Halorhabdus tiamatea SARL4B TaxID=1033806 RepID=F7PL63_9EURY|nr:Nif3-like dinuclear metal center hexameric protein [Halorhabdus tiamatea]ERJ05874.1 NGG1p interacting factor 3 protein [Halorhabdus tiamatea SARL4B]CCQ34446.1 NGG1p interacting factor 3, NIF3 family protein [Halorhabdus tiamatea SARL4B]
MNCQELCSRFDERLDVDAYAGIDASENGLQVGPADQDVERVAFAVDAAVETIEQAAAEGTDLLVVHHGLLWGGDGQVTDLRYRRLQRLFEAEMALYAVHLPLDGHQDLGNAAGVADVLDLGNRAPFGEIDGEYIGQRGRAREPFAVEGLRERLSSELDTSGEDVQVLEFGPAEIVDIGVVTGSGTDWIDEAAAKGVDALVTGEGKQQVYHRAREHGIHVFLAGHYATETFGVRALAGLAEEWGVETTFVDHPTGL